MTSHVHKTRNMDETPENVHTAIIHISLYNVLPEAFFVVY